MSSIAAPMDISAGSIRLQLFRRMPIDAVAHAPYGPPPLSMIPKNRYRFSAKIVLK